MRCGASSSVLLSLLFSMLKEEGVKEPEIWKQIEGIEQVEMMEEELREHWLYIMLMDRPGNLDISESGLRAIQLNC